MFPVTCSMALRSTTSILVSQTVSTWRFKIQKISQPLWLRSHLLLKTILAFWMGLLMWLSGVPGSPGSFCTLQSSSPAGAWHSEFQRRRNAESRWTLRDWLVVLRPRATLISPTTRGRGGGLNSTGVGSERQKFRPHRTLLRVIPNQAHNPACEL